MAQLNSEAQPDSAAKAAFSLERFCPINICLSNIFDAIPYFATLGDEIVVRINFEDCGAVESGVRV